MNYVFSTVNPFYARRIKRDATRNEACDRPVYARLPLAPRNASPVPHLTSLYHFHRAGEYGDRKWPGNCGGNLIKDLLAYFQPDGLVFDPMSGSGTCAEPALVHSASIVHALQRRFGRGEFLVRRPQGPLVPARGTGSRKPAGRGSRPLIGGACLPRIA